MLASVMTKLGGYSKSRKISGVRGLRRYLSIRSLVRGANCV